jgi:hypothetical protein
MSKRTTIHLPLERHEQLKAIAKAHGFAKITEFLDDWISTEAGKLDNAASPFKLARDQRSSVTIEIDGIPKLTMTEKETVELITMLTEAINERLRLDMPVELAASGTLLSVGARGRGYELVVWAPAGTHTNGRTKYEPHIRGLTKSLALELKDALHQILQTPLPIPTHPR